MFKQRNKFLTVVFSILPGAGHMFMGFMKTGLSLMVMFFLVVFLSTWLRMGAFLYILPILIFYSFFDCINKSFSTPEEFARLEDNYIFSKRLFSGSNAISKGKGTVIAGIVIILIGFDLLLSSVVNNLDNYLINFSSTGISRIISALTNVFPQFVISFAIIAIGLYLIIGKKRSNDNND